MTETENLVLEQLRAIRADIAESREGQARIETRLTAIEHHMAGLITSFGGQQNDLDSLRRRVERIEQRLQLTD